MAFNRDEVADLLVKCHRRCCICHRFCGFKIETDHMQPTGEGGKDDIDNALPVCFECHSEIHCYNNDHPRGRKFTERELRGHKEQWLRICENNPGILSQPFQSSDAGPLNSLVDEMEYNRRAGAIWGSSLSTSQFNEALRRGAISLLEPDLKYKINLAYSKTTRLNRLFYALSNEDQRERVQGYNEEKIRKYTPETQEAITNARDSLLSFLQKDTEATQ